MSLAPTGSPGTDSSESNRSTGSNATATTAHSSANTGLPVKRGRRSNPKVKTGCTNCKQRRIKCDEKRPECSQCVRSSKPCTGYPAPSRGSRPVAEVRIAPKPLLAMQPAPASSSTGSAHPVVSVSMIQKQTVLPPRRVGRRRKMPPVYKAIAAQATPLTLYLPSMALSLQPTEAMYFDLFRLRTASQLSGYFNSNFWTQRVLQECHGESAIRHSVIALGALYKTLEQSFARPHPGVIHMQHHSDSILVHWQVAIKQYSDACNAMLSIKDDTLHGHQIRLMAIILLACFDSFIGDHKQAIIQIQTGLGLLEQFQAQQPSNILAASSAPQDELVTLFGRLAIQAKSYDMAFHFPHPYVIKLHSPTAHAESPGSDRSSPSLVGSPPREGVFENLSEARLASDKLCMALLLFIEKLHAAKTDPSYVLPASWKKYGMGLRDRLAAWSDAFEPILSSRHRPETPLIERAGISALKMFQVNTNVIFLMLFCDNEVQFDSFMPHFKMIVDLGWEVVGADESRFAAAESHHHHHHHMYDGSSPAPGYQHAPQQQQYHHGTKGAFRAGKYSAGGLKPSFSADLGIVPPLYVVATKCRDPWLRRQAIQLLKSSARREGMWDSELTSNIATWVMKLEEQGVEGGGGAAVPPAFDPRNPMGGYTDSQGVVQRTIPEDRRIMVKSVEFDLRARFADITVGTRAVFNGSQDVRLRDTRISW